MRPLQLVRQEGSLLPQKAVFVFVHRLFLLAAHPEAEQLQVAVKLFQQFVYFNWLPLLLGDRWLQRLGRVLVDRILEVRLFDFTAFFLLLGKQVLHGKVGASLTQTLAHLLEDTHKFALVFDG